MKTMIYYEGLFWLFYEINLIIVLKKRSKIVKYYIGWIILDLKFSLINKILKRQTTID